MNWLVVTAAWFLLAPVHAHPDPVIPRDLHVAYVREQRRIERHRRHLRLLRTRPLHAARWARRELGTPYVWGGSEPGGFDCSGLVQWAYRQVGVWLPRTTWEMRNAGRWAPLNRLHTGDLVFANGGEHVGMYAGGGLVIQAPYTGTVVQLSPLSRFGAEFARRVA